MSVIIVTLREMVCPLCGYRKRLLKADEAVPQTCPACNDGTPYQWVSTSNTEARP